MVVVKIAIAVDTRTPPAHEATRGCCLWRKHRLGALPLRARVAFAQKSTTIRVFEKLTLFPWKPLANVQH